MTKPLTARQMARMVEKLLGDETHQYPAGSRVDPYTVLVSGADGKISCDCRGWITKKKDKPRRCKHADHAVLKYVWDVELRGDYYHRIPRAEA